MTLPGLELVAISDRSDYDESYHFAAAVALDPAGSVALAIGDPELHVYPRSANKPLQATAMLRAGLDLPADLLALVCASHAGTPAHVAGVRRILDGAGLREADLANTPDYPLDPPSMRDVVRAGGDRSALQMNCSGKHAGMLATCRVRSWPTDPSYLDLDHPLQATICDVIAELAAEAITHVGIDGCGAPAHVLSLMGLARAFRAVATSAAGTPERRVYDAMRTHPFAVGGPGRDVSTLMEGVPGLMAKDGADGMFAAALPDGRAVAVKMSEGGDRARPVVVAAMLAALGVDVTQAASAWQVPILGHGHPVGRVRPVGVLASHLRA